MRRIHKLLGLLMLAPLLLWGITGLVFLVKPGYDGAYEQLAPRFYPLDLPAAIKGPDTWSQVRLLRTVLGDHLLVQEEGAWRHLDPVTQSVRAPPSEDAFLSLVSDAIRHNPGRYGRVTSIEGATALTDTGVEITLDWDTLSLRQKGNDTRTIQALYRIHYLQWTPSSELNVVLGALGIALLLTLSLVGLRLVFSSPPVD